MVFNYHHFILSSNFALPSLLPGEGPADIALELIRDSNPLGGFFPDESLHPETFGRAQRMVRRGGNTLHIAWELDGTFLEMKLSPTECTIRLDPCYTIEHAERALFTICKKELLGEMGQAFLHASCVAREGRAFAFVGPTEAGKTTLAGALAAFAGYALYADDAFPWTSAGGETGVSQGSLLLQIADCSPLKELPWPRLERLKVMVKTVIRAPLVAPHQASLSGVFVLETGPLGLHPLGQGEAMAALLPFLGTGYRKMSKRDIRHLHSLVKSVRVASLSIPRDVDLKQTASKVDQLLQEFGVRG